MATIEGAIARLQELADQARELNASHLTTMQGVLANPKVLDNELSQTLSPIEQKAQAEHVAIIQEMKTLQTEAKLKALREVGLAPQSTDAVAFRDALLKVFGISQDQWPTLYEKAGMIGDQTLKNAVASALLDQPLPSGWRPGDARPWDVIADKDPAHFEQVQSYKALESKIDSFTASGPMTFDRMKGMVPGLIANRGAGDLKFADGRKAELLRREASRLDNEANRLNA